MGSGTEVALCTGAREELAKQGVQARVVSFPSWELFDSQPQEYKTACCRRTSKRGCPWRRVPRSHGVDMSATRSLRWRRSIWRFGSGKVIAEHLGLTVENVVQHALKVLGRG
jgi:transketolase